MDFLPHSLSKDYLVRKHRLVLKLSKRKKTQLQLIALFSLYLTPKSVDNAEITFGGIDESKFKGEVARNIGIQIFKKIYD